MGTIPKIKIGYSTLIIMALVLRLVLAPFSYHPWEYRTYVNTANDLHNGVNPYTHLIELSEETRERYPDQFAHYEYWAYPPVGLGYLYLVGLADPEPVPYFAETYETLPDPVISLLLKLPGILGDFLVALFLMFLTRSRRVSLLWLYMPMSWFVSSIWGSFDSLAVAAMLAAILAYKRPGIAGFALATGAAIKMFPVVLAPLIWRRSARFLAVGVMVGILVSVYYLFDAPGDYVGACLGFHGERAGAGLTVWNVWQLGTMNGTWEFIFTWVWWIPLVGLLGWTYLRHKSDRIITRVALALMAFLLCSKVVNPIYALWVIPFLLVCYRSTAQILIWQCLAILWIFVNYGSVICFFGYIANSLGLSAEMVPADDRYMLYLGLGWLFWALTLVMFLDMWRKKGLRY